jgi:hypothetical protein
MSLTPSVKINPSGRLFYATLQKGAGFDLPMKLAARFNFLFCG